MAYEKEVLQGLLHGVLASGVTGLRTRVAQDFEGPPPHAVHALSRVFGDRVEPGSFVLTTGLGQTPLRTTAPGSLVRFELMTWVDDLAFAPEHAASGDVLKALSVLGRLIHDAAEPGTPPWFLGQMFTFDGEGLAGWRRFLLARSMRPLVTEAGEVDIVRVLPISDEEAEEVRAKPETLLDGWTFVMHRENEDFLGVQARWRNPPHRAPPRPAETLRATRAVYEGAGDTLRIYVDRAAWSGSAMRDARLFLDADGFLVGMVLHEDAAPRAQIVIGPPDRVASTKDARVLQGDDFLLVTMGAKRVRGHEKNPYLPWSIHSPS